MNGLPHTLKYALQTFFEKCFCLLFIPMPIRGGDQFLRFGNEHCAEQVRIDATKRLTEPDIEKVGEVGIPNIIVIGGVCRKQKPFMKCRGSFSIALLCT